MRQTVRRVLLPLSIAAISLTGTARAERPEAERRFAEGDALLKAGDLAAACAAFEASNEREPRAGTLIRLGDCREQKQELASALAAYGAAIARAKDPTKRRLASTKIRELTPKVSTLTINVAATGTVTVTRNGNTVAPAAWHQALPVDGGRYTIVATAPGYERFETIVSIEAAAAKVVVEVPQLRPLAAPPVPSPTVAAQQVIESDHSEVEAVDERPQRSLTKRPVFWIGVGAAVLAGSVAIYVATRSGAEPCMANCIDLR